MTFLSKTLDRTNRRACAIVQAKDRSPGKGYVQMRCLVVGVCLLANAACQVANPSASDLLFSDDFEQGLQQWELSGKHRIHRIDSQDPAHGKVLALHPGGDNIYALVKGSEGWNHYRVEGDVLFPEDEQNYLGFIYHYNQRHTRVDYGCIYIKGNGSYIRVNPHRDGLVARTIYEEYKTDLTGASAIVIGQWQRFKAEVVDSVVHFYVGDMDTPKVTFDHYEFSSGRVGFEPRIYGSPVWIDNIKISAIETLSYQGGILPAAITYKPEQFITQWHTIGPFRRRVETIEADGYLPEKPYRIGIEPYRWTSFSADGRGSMVSGRIFEYPSAKSLVYFHAEITSEQARETLLQFSSTNHLTVWLNGKAIGEIEPTYRAWHDFLEVPDHQAGELRIELEQGANQLMLLAKSVGLDYTGDGFYVHLGQGR